ncbi:MAG: hypothetical protein K2W96_15045 [Gemmataceae bacterium]|nr:hypothetical protein [Gemmataceae bacterium]
MMEWLASVWAVIKWVPCVLFLLLAALAVLSHLLWLVGRLPRWMEPPDRCPPIPAWFFLIFAGMLFPVELPDAAVLVFFALLVLESPFLRYRPHGGMILVFKKGMKGLEDDAWPLPSTATGEEERPE